MGYLCVLLVSRGRGARGKLGAQWEATAVREARGAGARLGPDGTWSEVGQGARGCGCGVHVLAQKQIRPLQEAPSTKAGREGTTEVRVRAGLTAVEP